MRHTLIPVRALAAAGTSTLLLGACGGPSSPADRTSADLRARVPQAVRDAGVLKIGSDLNYPPVDFKTPDAPWSGLDPDLAAALGSYLGLKVEFVDMPFDKLIPAVQAKKVDLAMSAVIDTQRRQLGTDDRNQQVDPGVDFIDYFMTGTSILVKGANPLGISTLDSLCGRTVAVQRGTIQDEVAQRQINACQKLNKPLQVHELGTDADAQAEVLAGTAAADLNDFPVAVYNTAPERGGRFRMIGAYVQSSPYGITVNKENTGLRDVLAHALDQLIRNGEYDKILTKWGIERGAVTSAVVNGGL
ncbi:ABC transporter substrate-binding protein [Kitasatospora paracochleata]|uniref:Polar amino acid transport system substrate-binding protein n=1 Tax=Kitasatospora paracochleata TaxID=58354 RepID=A0ABT1IVG7_9ACTN|nr:ABC transporter substrate-binding protein [Kitasatospora paracochleata]MCP2309117.1 polar amino acid transport system substrate-binding protein [Kitasatospora paracochleata]